MMDVEFGLGAFGFHEPAGEEGNENSTEGEHEIGRYKI